eukprot:s1242_g7.t1
MKCCQATTPDDEDLACIVSWRQASPLCNSWCPPVPQISRRLFAAPGACIMGCGLPCSSQVITVRTPCAAAQNQRLCVCVCSRCGSK